jgi:2-polyprenyl-3-methyl-5-hydroxy-6-metoxy-1,4-benzoquinol methylase
MRRMSSNGESEECRTAIQADSARCIVCGGNRAPSRRLAALVQCKECGFLDLRISDAELQSLYGEAYFKGQGYLDYIAEEPSLLRNFRNRLARLKTVAPQLACCDLFEIGCAYGFFLKEAAQWVRSASGIDIAAEPIRSAVQERGVEALQGDYLSLDLGRKFDVIAMWDTIEHLRYPHLFIEKIVRDLKPGGLLALTTGDIDSLTARLQGRHWRLLCPPAHLHYFSAATISELLRRKGFQIVHLSYAGNSRSLRAALYFVTVLRMKRKGLYDALQGLPIFNFHLTVNLFDIMYVIARRQC